MWAVFAWFGWKRRKALMYRRLRRFSLGRAGDKFENPKKKLKFSNKNCKFFRKTDYFCGHIGTTLLLITIFKCYSL